MASVKGRVIGWLLGFIVLAFALNLLLDANQYKDWLAQKVGEPAGLTVHIGSLDYSLLEPGNVQLQQVTVADAEQQQLLALAGLKASVQLWPLLTQSQLLIDSIELQKLRVQGSDEALQKILDRLNKDSQTYTTEPAAITSVLIAGVKLEDINIDWLTGKNRLHLASASLHSQQLQWQNQQTRGSIQLAIPELKWNDFAVQLANAELAVAGNDISLNNLNIKTMDGELGAEGQFNLSTQEGDISLALTDMQVKVDDTLLAQLGVARADEDDASDSAPLPVKRLFLTQLKVNNTAIDYALGEHKFSLGKLDAEVANWPLIIDGQPWAGRAIEERGEFSINAAEVNFAPYKFQTFSAQGELQQHLMTLSPMIVDGEGLDINIAGQLDFAEERWPFEVHSESFNLRIDESRRDWFPGAIWPQGQVRSAFRLTGDGHNLLPSLAGEIELESKDLLLTGINLDKILTALEDSEKTSLLDVGSFMVTGPLGLIANQVVNLGHKGMASQSGLTQFRHLYLDATLADGVMTSKDMAMTTSKHRAAFNGQIDYVQRRFKGLDFYILNKKNCASIKQTLDGPMDSPDGIFSSAVSTTVFKPFTRLLSEASDWLSDCKPVYQGKVAPLQSAG